MDTKYGRASQIYEQYLEHLTIITKINFGYNRKFNAKKFGTLCEIWYA